MRAIGIIPARMASTRFPGKPLTHICGRPMLWHVWQAAKAARLIEPYYVATDSAEIASFCESENIDYIITSSECRSGTERCHDAMRQLAIRDQDEVILNIQGDEPTIQGESLDALARAFIDPAVKIASLYYKPETPASFSNRNRVKVLVGETGNALAFTRSGTAAVLWRLYGQHVGVYGYRRDILARLVSMPPEGDLEQVAWMRAGYDIRMVEIKYETVAVDVPEDVAEVEKRLNCV